MYIPSETNKLNVVGTREQLPQLRITRLTLIQ